MPRRRPLPERGSAIFPTGYHAIELANVQPGESVVIYGAGPVGLMADYLAVIRGAGRVMIVDRLELGITYLRSHSKSSNVTSISRGAQMVFKNKSRVSLSPFVPTNPACFLLKTDTETMKPYATRR